MNVITRGLCFARSPGRWFAKIQGSKDIVKSRFLTQIRTHSINGVIHEDLRRASLPFLLHPIFPSYCCDMASKPVKAHFENERSTTFHISFEISKRHIKKR